MPSGSFVFYWVHSCAMVVVGYIRVCLGSFGRSIVSLGSLGFHSAAPRDRRVHSGSSWFTTARLGLQGFIRVNSGASGGRLVHSGACGITRGRIGVVGFIRVGVG